MRSHMIFDPCPDFVRINERQREFASLWPGAEQQATFGAASISGALGIGKIRQVMFKVIFVYRLQMAGDFFAVQYLPNAADERQPGTEDAIGQAAISVLILWPFFFKYRHGFGRAELHVISVMMRLLHQTPVPGIPSFDAVIQTAPDLGPEPAQPLSIAADPPIAEDFHDAAKLAVSRGVEIVLHRADRQRTAE